MQPYGFFCREVTSLWKLLYDLHKHCETRSHLSANMIKKLDNLSDMRVESMKGLKNLIHERLIAVKENRAMRMDSLSNTFAKGLGLFVDFRIENENEPHKYLTLSLHCPVTVNGLKAAARSHNIFSELKYVDSNGDKKQLEKDDELTRLCDQARDGSGTVTLLASGHSHFEYVHCRLCVLIQCTPIWLFCYNVTDEFAAFFRTMIPTLYMGTLNAIWKRKKQCPPCPKNNLKS